MKLSLALLSFLMLCWVSAGQAGFMDKLQKTFQPSAASSAGVGDAATIAKGLKEALAVGTERAVKEVSRTDGYFGNQMIKILLPDKVRTVAEVLKKVGYQEQVDGFVLSMNRAAEKAAPKAAGFFADAIRQMTLEDAKGILKGGDTAATNFFENKTRARLYDAFKPTVAASMDQVGTARAYKSMLGSYQATPLASLAGTPALDLDEYVTNKALDGLFRMVAEEEKKIRTNPAARTTDLLRKVFGGK